MIEIIKSLTGKQKFIAVLIITLITSVSSILTIYFKTDDCKGISDQYTALVKNQMELMSINNKLLSQYNVARRDLKMVNSLVDDMDSLAKVVKIQSKEIVSNNENDIVVTNLESMVEPLYDTINPIRERTSMDNNENDIVVTHLDSVKVSIFETNEPRQIKTKTKKRNKIVIKTPIEIKNYIDSINKITSKY